MNTFSKIFDQLDRELWLVTAQYAERASGLVASYVTSVSLVPTLPRVTIALAKHHFTHELIEQSSSFCLHLITEGQLDWVWRFGIRSGRQVDKLQGLATTSAKSGAPILSGALAWIDCRVEARMDTGDRTIYLAEVLDANCGTFSAAPAGSRDTGEAHSVSATATPLTIKRLLELAPAEHLREMKQAMERDIEIDRAAILAWRTARAGAGQGKHTPPA